MSFLRLTALACTVNIGVCIAQTGVTPNVVGAATTNRSAPRISPALDTNELPPGGVWTRKAKPDGSGEKWTYDFTIAEPGADVGTAVRRVAGPATAPSRVSTSLAGTTKARAADPRATSPLGDTASKSNADTLEAPPFGGIIQRRFVLDSDPRQRSLTGAGGWYEFWFDSTVAAPPAEVAAVNPRDQRGWVKVDEPNAALLRARGIPYRRVVPGSLAGISADGLGMTVEAGTPPASAHLASRFALFTATGDQPGISAFDINFEEQPQDRQVSSVRFYLKLSHPHLDQLSIWLSTGDRETVLWDGRGGSNDAGFDDDPENDANITLNRVLSNELRGVSLSGHWTLYIANGNQDAVGTLEEFWLLAASTPRNAGLEAELVRPAASPTLDIVAQRAYLKTASGGGGSEVPSPVLGQTVYFTVDWQINGSGGPVTFSNQALLDGSQFCSFSVSLGVGNWTSWCNTGWAVTAGTHTLEWDLDYTKAVAETNENNNTAVTQFAPTGLDVIAQRAYMKTAPGSGSEVSAPAQGQVVYFTADWQIAGASGNVTVSNRAVLDGATSCSGSSAFGNGSWISWCTNGWTATAGTHTLEWDFDYTNQLAEINESNNSASAVFTTTGVDLVAQRAYMRTAAGGGTEVTTPSLGQTVYFTLDWSLSGASVALTVPERAVLDGATFCSFNAVEGSGSWTSWCGNGWAATAGTHTLEWDLDYTNSILETNENNNTVVIQFTTPGLDVIAQRAYLKTAPGSGSEVSSPAPGQTVYLTADWQIAGAGSTVTVSNRAVLDSNTICSVTSTLGNGSWTSWCNNGWTATAGSHTLEWDFDYTNQLAEINESNNSATTAFTSSGIDILAQRAYLQTGAGSGSQVTTPSLGQIVYFTVDWVLTGVTGTLTVPLRATLDGATFCASNDALAAGSWTTWCVGGWAATAGAHTLEWDFDYTNSIVETNENNNTAIDTFSTPAGSFSVSVSPSSQTLIQGQATNYTVTVQSQNGFSGPVSLTALNLPGNQVLPGTGFSPQSVTPPANGSVQSTLTVVTNNQTPTGTFAITVNGTNSGSTKGTSITLAVNPAAAPTITSSPPSGPQGTTFTITGSGFTPNGSVRRFYIIPGQTQVTEISQITASASGQINWPYTSQCTDAVGVWPLWAIDVGTNQQSNQVTQLITASTTCSAPTITGISPASPTVSSANQTVTVAGSGFQVGLTVTAFPPAGTSIAPQIQNVSSTGFQMQIQLNVTGTWGIRVKTPDGQQSGTFNFVVVQATQSWTRLAQANPSLLSEPGTALLLTDGTIMVHNSQSSNWFKLTPDPFGSYIKGTWASLPAMQSQSAYAPLFFSSAVLGDGRVVVIGGEYNSGLKVWTNLGSVYDAVANTWAALAPPTHGDGSVWTEVGDAQNVVLPDGRLLLANFSTVELALLDPATLKWTTATSSNKADRNDEEGWTLLPNGKLLTVNAEASPGSQIYDPSLGTWTPAGNTGTVNLEDMPSEELGPQVLRPDGTVIAFGATDHSAVYNVNTGNWANGPSFPLVGGKQLAVPDGPAVLLPSGNVLVGASPLIVNGNFPAPTTYFEFDGTNLNQLAAQPPNALNHGAYQTRMLLLPTGQVLLTDGSRDIEIYTPSGSPNSTWAPTISSAPSTVQLGETYTITGTQFNGLSQGNAYGDDVQAATNYPLVRITNTASGHVFYARTHDHSTMGVATGSTPVSTKFDIGSIETGPSTLVVVANGIPSNPWPLTVTSGLPDVTIAIARSGSFTQGQNGASYTMTISNVGAAPTSAAVTVTDLLAVGLTAVSISGNGWNCTQPAGPCTRLDPLASNSSYPALTLTVNIATNAPPNIASTVTVSGGGEVNTSNDTATDSTGVPSPVAPALAVTLSHNGNLAQGQSGATYSIVVSNNVPASRTTGQVTVTETIPNGLTLVSMYGTGWSCSGPACTRSDSLDGGTSYPAITVLVNVGFNAPPQVTNQVDVSLGGSASASASDPTTVNSNPPVLSIISTHTGNFTQGQSATYTISVSNGPAAGPTVGVVIVTETVPSGLTLTSMSGLGWSCSSNACARSDVLNPGNSYPPISVVVNVLANATSPQVNAVSISGGGATGASTTDSTTITPIGPGSSSFFANEIALGNGVYYLPFANGNLFGYYEHLSSSIIYHFDLGFEGIIQSNNSAEVYLYDFTSGHWFYTSPSLFPYLYDFTLGAWLYYFPDAKNPGHYTTNPRSFVNLSTNKIFTM